MTTSSPSQTLRPESAQSSKKRIVLLTASLARGGAEIVVLDLARGLQKRGWQTSVVSMLPPQDFVDDLQVCGIEVVSLDMRPGSLSLRPLFKFREFLKRTRPALIHAHMFHASILARLIRFIDGPPIVCTVQNTNEGSQRTGKANLREWIFRLTNFVSDANTGVSNLVKERYVHEGIVPRDGMEVIPNGVDMDLFHRAPDQARKLRGELGWGENFIWLAAARFVIAKDYPNLIEAFREVHRAFPTAHLAIAGEGILRQDIQNRIQSAGLSHAVTLLGLRTDMPDLMRACDAFVMASAWEGGPLVLVEACASERPAVTTNVGSAAQIVDHEQTGFIVPTRNPAALAEAMISVMTMGPTVRERMGSLARKKIVKQFSLVTVHSQYVNLYERILAKAQ